MGKASSGGSRGLGLSRDKQAEDTEIRTEIKKIKLPVGPEMIQTGSSGKLSSRRSDK